MTVRPVILSGGSGTRLWPLSRELFPKQMLPLCSERSMLQETVARVSGLAEVTTPLILCNEDHRFIVSEQLRQMGRTAQVVVEPSARNTAAAIAAAALLADADDVLLVLPSDHAIEDGAAFADAVTRAVSLARQGRLVTFGIVPTRAETGYGYIRRGAALGAGAFAVDRFVEKPDRATAQSYLDSGEYAWNSGLFVFRAGDVLAEMAAHAPDIVAACRAAVSGASRDADFVRLEATAFAAAPSRSVDYAVMEKTAQAAVVPVEMGWSDIGSWSALAERQTADADGNVLVGDVVAVDSTGNYLRGESRLVAAVGLRDLVVVETADAVLVATKDRVQDVRQVVERLKRDKRDEAVAPKRTYRPWGWFETIDEGDRFKVKQIEVTVGARLSLQRHQHRSEHWIVVRGTATVTCGDKVMMLQENQSTFIPAGTVHRLENRGKIALNIIEVQSGPYVGEDDIERVEDVYGRVSPAGAG